jgi:DNA-directed RNA polymerase sigma subunit (sigma70/sigma32)
MYHSYMEYKKLLKQWEKRRAEMRALRAKGWTLERVGKRYGISRQRVLQIVEGKQ